MAKSDQKINSIKMDVDDPFDSIVFLEERHVQDGYNQGYSQGQVQGLQEGFRLGAQKGKLLGEELGFYKGFCDILLLHLNKVEKSNPSLIRNLEEISTKLSNLKYDDAQNQELFDAVAVIRNKFKRVEAFQKVKLTFGSEEPTDLSF